MGLRVVVCVNFAFAMDLTVVIYCREGGRSFLAGCFGSFRFAGKDMRYVRYFSASRRTFPVPSLYSCNFRSCLVFQRYRGH